MNEEVIQDFTEKEALEKQQVEATQAKVEDFEAELPGAE